MGSLRDGELGWPAEWAGWWRPGCRRAVDAKGLGLGLGVKPEKTPEFGLPVTTKPNKQ